LYKCDFSVAAKIHIYTLTGEVDMSHQDPLPIYGKSPSQKKGSYMEIIQSISFLTKLGALCLITGKLFMFIAVAGIFVPALNAYAIPCTIIWGSLVFTSIILCSVDHYINRRETAPVYFEPEPVNGSATGTPKTGKDNRFRKMAKKCDDKAMPG
jgi:hypothetical protein